ncbi:transmembrane protein, putative [Medicago truncatula]|uniref:Transmembrane protein, putative n=1 Tax=Medicago truncatula TaxID=3880 RepID=G7ISG3_MEDTR|nr:transmembrane protein, putative [Medicago truncatula]
MNHCTKIVCDRDCSVIDGCSFFTINPPSQLQQLQDRRRRKDRGGIVVVLPVVVVFRLYTTPFDVLLVLPISVRLVRRSATTTFAVDTITFTDFSQPLYHNLPPLAASVRTDFLLFLIKIIHKLTPTSDTFQIEGESGTTTRFVSLMTATRRQVCAAMKKIMFCSTTTAAIRWVDEVWSAMMLALRYSKRDSS